MGRTENTKVAFRVDASNDIGIGHITRCLTLADELKHRGVKCFFICNELPGNLPRRIMESGHEYRQINSLLVTNLSSPRYIEFIQHDASQTLASLGSIKPYYLIVDHYGLGLEWEQFMRPHVNKIFVIDDLANRRHDCDILLDYNAYSDFEFRYSEKVPGHCKCLLGPQYALLREEFRIEKRHLKRNAGPIKRVMLSFGGTDPFDNTSLVLDVFETPVFSNLILDVIIGLSHPNREKILKRCSQKPNWHVHIDTARMARIMSDCDLSIGAGGVSTWERLYMELPCLVKVVASNQLEALQYLASKQIINIWSSPHELKQLLEKHLYDGFSLPDCGVHHGTKEIAETIFPEVELHPFDFEHIDATYEWLSSAELRQMFLMKNAPTTESNQKYWNVALSDTRRIDFAIYFKGEHIGNCGLKNLDRKSSSAELWLYVGERKYRGHGVGEASVKLLETNAKSRIPNGRLYLHVGESNRSAIALYKKMGYSMSFEGISNEWRHRPEKVFRMEKKI